MSDDKQKTDGLDNNLLQLVILIVLHSLEL